MSELHGLAHLWHTVQARDESAFFEERHIGPDPNAQRRLPSPFGKAPLFPVAAGLLAGVVCDEAARVDGFWYVVVFLAATVTLLVGRLPRSMSPMVVLIGAFCAGGSWHQATARQTPPDSVTHLITSDKQLARLRGRVASPPRTRQAAPLPFQHERSRRWRTSFLLDVESLLADAGPVEASGRIRITVGEPILGLREGERIEIFGWLYRLRPPGNPGSFDWARFNRRRGIVARMSCNVSENLRRLDVNSPGSRGLVTHIRARVRGWLTDDLTVASDDEAGLLSAMILGHRSQLDRRLNEIFLRAGCAHFLAVSGVHVVIVMSLARLIGLLLGIPLRPRIALTLAVVLLYGLVIAEPRPSILRATIIATAYSVSRLLGRERASLNWISASAVVLMLVDTNVVFRVGFQLSYAAVLGVVYLAPALRAAIGDVRGLLARLFLGRTESIAELEAVVNRLASGGHVSGGRRFLQRTLWPRLAVAMSIAFGAWLATVPIVLFHFGELYLWGAPFSVVVMPLVGVVMAVGIAKVVASAIYPTVGLAIQHLLSIADGWLLTTVDFLSRAPAAVVQLPPPSAWLFAAYYLFLALLIAKHSRANLDRKAKPTPDPVTRQAGPVMAGACCLSFAVLLSSTVLWLRPAARADELVVTCLAVGAGSATIIELPDGRTVVYDAGTSGSYDAGRHTILPFLRHRRIDELDSIYVSHANLDHFSAVPTLVDELRIGRVLINQYFEARSPRRSSGRMLLDELASRGSPIVVRDGAQASWFDGGVSFERLWPPEGVDDSRTTNDTSTVLRVSYAGRSILLTGDIEERAQRALLQRGDLHADVLVLPHHGSVRPSTEAFIRAVGADVLIRSSHQRMSDTVNGLAGVVEGRSIFNTADVGAVRVSIDASGVRVEPCLQAPNPR